MRKLKLDILTRNKDTNKIIRRGILSKEQLKSYKRFHISSEGDLLMDTSKEETKRRKKKNEEEINNLINEIEIKDLAGDNTEKLERKLDAKKKGYKAYDIISRKVVQTKEGSFYEINKDGDVFEIERPDINKLINNSKNLKITEIDDDILFARALRKTGKCGGEKVDLKLALEYLLELKRRAGENTNGGILKMIAECYEKFSEFSTAIDYYNLALKKYPRYKNTSNIGDHIDYCKIKLKEGKTL